MKSLLPFAISIVLHGAVISLLSSCRPANPLEAEHNVIDFMRSKTRVQRLGEITGHILSQKIVNHRGTWFAVVAVSEPSSGFFSSRYEVVLQFDTKGHFVSASRDRETVETLVSVANEQGWSDPMRDGIAVMKEDPEVIVDPLIRQYSQ